MILVFPYCALYQIIPARRINAKHQIQGITILDFIVIDNFGIILRTPHRRINIFDSGQTITGICTFHRLCIETIRLVVIIRHAGHSICHSCIAKTLPDRIIYKAVSRQITGRKRPILAGCSILCQNAVFDDDTISLLVTKIKSLGEPTLRQVIPVQRIVRRCSRCCCRRVSDRVIIAEIIQQRIGKRGKGTICDIIAAIIHLSKDSQQITNNITAAFSRIAVQRITGQVPQVLITRAIHLDPFIP